MAKNLVWTKIARLSLGSYELFVWVFIYGILWPVQGLKKSKKFLVRKNIEIHRVVIETHQKQPGHA